MPDISNINSLAKDQIDLWYINPNQVDESQLDQLRSNLIEQEHLELLRYKNKQAQKNALIARASCRLVVSQYNNIATLSQQFYRDKHGKPHLLDNQLNLQFNLSHNADAVVIAVSINDPVGCDIESAQRRVSIDTISKRYFAPIEHQQLQDMSEADKQVHFFKIWTLKEAFVKATGRGISLGLETFFFDKEKLLTVQFTENYPLEKNSVWQFNQQSLDGQLLAICRASSLAQHINIKQIACLL